MRVTFNASFLQTAADLERVAGDLAERQRQVSSGKRVQHASDDPRAAESVVRERGELAAADAYLRVADGAAARLTYADTVLDDIVERLTSAKTIALSARGSAVPAVQRDAAARQLQSIRDTLVSDFNTAFRGVHLFSGSAALTPPYALAAGTVSAYQGQNDDVEVDIDRHGAVRIALDGEAITRGGDAQDVFQVLDALATAVAANDQAAIQQHTAALDRAFTRATTAQTRVGTDLDLIATQQARLGDRRRAIATRISALEDANLADAITRMNQADAAYRAALGSIGAGSGLSLMDYLR